MREGFQDTNKLFGGLKEQFGRLDGNDPFHIRPVPERTIWETVPPSDHRISHITGDVKKFSPKIV